MSQDLRKLFDKEREYKYRMKEGHEERFREMLDESMPVRKSRFFRNWSIAASVVILLGLGIYFVTTTDNSPVQTTVVDKGETEGEDAGISLGDLSPDLKKLENYYVANINLAISELQVSPENKVLVDSYMGRLAELNTEYENLNKELNEIGPNDQTIAALIRNLQLRLDLLYKLKDKLNEFKSSKNGQVTSNNI